MYNEVLGLDSMWLHEECPLICHIAGMIDGVLTEVITAKFRYLVLTYGLLSGYDSSWTRDKI
jgi:hypothetical protein